MNSYVSGWIKRYKLAQKSQKFIVQILYYFANIF